jgi:hypothetical protein
MTRVSYVRSWSMTLAGSKRGASDGRYRAFKSYVQPAKLLVELLLAACSHWLDLYGMQDGPPSRRGGRVAVGPAVYCHLPNTPSPALTLGASRVLRVFSAVYKHGHSPASSPQQGPSQARHPTSLGHHPHAPTARRHEAERPSAGTPPWLQWPSGPMRRSEQAL